MKVSFRPATNCPFGGLLIEAENDNDRTILETFLWPSKKGDSDWKFCLHNYGSSMRHVGIDSFFFGWRK
jgi:hypothetical protein